jgi:hypothetical protein
MNANILEITTSDSNPPSKMMQFRYNESSDIKQMSEERKQRSAVQQTNANMKPVAWPQQNKIIMLKQCHANNTNRQLSAF